MTKHFGVPCVITYLECSDPTSDIPKGQNSRFYQPYSNINQDAKQKPNLH